MSDRLMQAPIPRTKQVNPYTNPRDPNEFQARSYPVRIYSGQEALLSLPYEIKRQGIQRALLLCGRSVHEKTALTQRITELAGGRLVGIFPDISEGAPSECIEKAANVARELQADGLIGLGAGSVLKGVRVVAMLMAENQTLEQMNTRYVEGQLPFSPRLLSPKRPIINVLTAPTTAQNRAGSALRHHGAVHQLEFFDPKTRPGAIFWDAGALATAPISLMRTTGLEVYYLALMGMGVVKRCNPIVMPSRFQAWELARSALPRVVDPQDSAARLDLCAAAYLQNRDEDDGGQPLKTHLIARACYALSVAVFNQYQGVTQSHCYAALTGSSIRNFGDLCPDVVIALGSALGVQASIGDERLKHRVAAAADDAFRDLGWPVDLNAAGILTSDVANLANFAIRNYNANSDGILTPYSDLLQKTLSDSLRAC